MRRPLIVILIGALSLAGCGGTGTGSATTAATEPSSATACIPAARRGKMLCGAVAIRYCHLFRPVFEAQNRIIAESYAGANPSEERVVRSLRKRCLTVGVDLGPIASGKPPSGAG